MKPLFFKCFGRFGSQIFGAFANLKLPIWARKIVYEGILIPMGINTDEIPKPPISYPTTNAFFTRTLKPESRPIDATPGAIVSPVDAVVSQFGTISESQLIQAKGLHYSVSDLLGVSDVEYLEGGQFATFYLSPTDCHLIFSPLNGDVKAVRHIPGYLYPVREPYISGHSNLFTENERVVVDMEHNGRRFSVVLVGAYNVGSMSVPFDDRIQTNINTYDVAAFDYNDTTLNTGDHLGTFHLGSTVILTFDASFYSPLKLEQDQTIRYGTFIGQA